ncbi:MAG TPA: hypothetical protein PLU87_14095 [Sedimentisphaerales bacterium]|nr:hypothetical protein [Sedimentisphaerales bacterium]
MATHDKSRKEPQARSTKSEKNPKHEIPKTETLSEAGGVRLGFGAFAPFVLVSDFEFPISYLPCRAVFSVIWRVS